DRDEWLKQLVKVEWLDEGSMTADEVTPQKSEEGPDEADEAAERLLHCLAQYAYTSQGLYEAGSKAGYSPTALFAAKTRLKRQARPSNKGGFQGIWCWGIGTPDSWSLRPQTMPPTAET